tara:strand:- start:46 stop:618 length:573 start_codon:yes stop_codon:yes gene_type:complete
MKNAQVRGEQTTITFAYMHKGARFMLNLAEDSQEGQLYTTISALVYCAFTLEAYLNHLGKLKNDDWEKIERRYSKIDKYKKFASAGNINFDEFRNRPYRTLKELFGFRDRMAHGRTTTESVNVSIYMPTDHLPQIYADKSWKSFATVENARIAIEDVETIVKELHSANGYPGNPFSKLGGGVYGISYEST